jgi:hypothetical protein
MNGPTFNKPNEKQAKYCKAHKTEDMVDVIHKQCLTNLCYETARNKQYEGYCIYCYINLFPEKPVSRNYRTKEKTIADHVISEYPSMTWRTDVKIQDGCSRRRPDLFLDLGYQVIIIEVDENQHIDYDCSCENKRLMELSKDVGHRSIVFIRFNPDHYINKEKQRIKSCWSINKQGISVINKNDKRDWIARLKTLTTQIQYWIDNKTEKTIEIIQLYYDEY